MSIERLVSPKSRECVDYTGVHHQHLLNNDNSIKRPPPPAMQQQLNVPRLRNMNHESVMDKGIIINSSRTTHHHHNILATSRTTTNRFPLMSPRTIVFEQHSSTEDDDESSSFRDSSVCEHYLRDVPEGAGLVPRHPRNVKRNNDRRARQLAPTSQEEKGRPSSALSPYYCWENHKRLDDYSSSCRHSHLIDNGGGGTYSLSMCSSSSNSTTSGTESLQRRWGQRKRTSETTIPHPTEQGGWVNRRRPALLETDRHQSEVSSCDTMTVCCLANTDSSTPATTTPPHQRDEEDMSSSSHHLRHSSPSTTSYQSQGRTSSSGGHPQSPETGTIPIRTVVSSTADEDIVHKTSEDQLSQMVSPQRVFGRGPPSRVVSSSDEVIVTVLDHPQATENGQLNSPTTTTNQSSRAVQHGFVLVGAECLASSSSSSATSSSSSSCSSNARMLRRQKLVVCNSTVSISSQLDDDDDEDVDGVTNSCSCVMSPSGKVDARLKQSPKMQWSHNNNNNNRSECSDSTNNDSGTFSWVPPGDATAPNNSPTIFEQNVLVVGSPSSNKSDSNKKNHNLQALSSRHHRSTIDKRSGDITNTTIRQSNVEVIPNSRPSLLNVKRKDTSIEQHATSRAGALTAREPPTEPKRYDAPLLHLKTFDVNSKSLNSSPSEQQQQHNMVKSSNSLIYSTRFRAAAAEVVEEMKAKSIDLTTIIPIEQLSFFLIRKQQTNNVKSASNNPELVSSNIPAPCGYSPNQLTQMGLTPFKINSGTFCSVYKAKYKNMVVAVKCPNEALLKSDASMMRYRALLEWKILSRTKHDNVLTFYGGLIFGAQVWLITAYAEGGDLYTLLYHRPVEQISAPVRLRLMSELANAVAYLHSMDPPVAHKDLKCNNLLVDSNDHLSICDFGDAEEMKSPFIQCCTAATWQYTPPELLASDDPSRPKNATEKVDVWALGCVYLEILKCPTPFVHILDTIGEDKQRETLRSLLLNSQLEKERRVPASLPRLIRLLILSCLEFIPAQRISAAQLALFLRRHHHDLLEEIELWQARALHKERTQIVIPPCGGGRPLPRLEHQLSSSSLASSRNAAHHIELPQHSTREHVAYRAAGVQLNSTSGSVLSSQDTGTEDPIVKHQQKDYYVQHQKNEDSGVGIDPDCGGGNSHHGYGLFRPMSARDNGAQQHHYQFQKRSMKPTYDSNVVFLKSSRAALDGLITARLSKGNGTEVSGGHSGRSLLNTTAARRPLNNPLGRSFMYKGDDSTSSSSADEDDDDDLDHVIYCQQNDSSLLTNNTRRKPCILSEPDFNRQQLNNIQRTHRRGNVVELKQAVTSSSTDRSNSPRLVSLASDRYYQPPMNSGRASGELTSFRTGQGFIVRGVEQRHVNAQNVAPPGMCGSCQENVVTTTTNHQVLLPLPSRRTKSIREDYYNGGGNRPHSAKENYSNNKINVCTIRNLEHHQTGDNSDSNVNGSMMSARRGNIDCLRRVTSTRPTTMRGIGEKFPAWGGSTTSNSVTSSSPPGERLDTSHTGNGNSYYNENNVVTSNMDNNPPTHMRPMCAVVMRNCGMKLRQMNSAHAHVAKPLSILKSAGPIHSSDASSITFPQYTNNRTTMAQHNNSVFSRGTSARNNNNNSGALVDVWHPCRPAPIRNYEIRKIMLSPETSSSSGNPNSHHFQVLAPSARLQQRQVHHRLTPTGGFSSVQGDATVVSSISHGGPHNGGTIKFDRNSVFQVLPVSRQQQQPSIRQFSRPPDDKLGAMSARQVASRM